MAECGRGVDGSSRRMETVLCVGNACVDFVNIAREYPVEDSDQRGLDYYWQRGGNATNSCTVLSILSVPCEFLGVLGSDGTEASWIKNDFDKHGIVTRNCLIKEVKSPVATVVLSQATGSRTIVYYPRDRPTLTYEEFHEIYHGDFTPYSWIHFELCSTIEDVSQMMDDVIAYNDRTCPPQCSDSHRSKVTISIEVEKSDVKNPELVMHKADIVFISKDFAKRRGYSSPRTAVEGLYNLCKAEAVLICAWGEVGATAHWHNTTFMAPALTGINVIDTLGAGDTFNAGVISSFWKHGHVTTDEDSVDVKNTVIQNAIEFGCRVAGLKCTVLGYHGLRPLVSSMS